MSILNSKAKAISSVVFGVIALLFLVLPVKHTLVIAVIYFLAVFTSILHFIALKKKGPWILLSWFWSAFLLPFSSAEILVMGYVGQYVPIETIAVWGLPVFVSLAPSTVWVLMKYVKTVCAEMY